MGDVDWSRIAGKKNRKYSFYRPVLPNYHRVEWEIYPGPTPERKKLHDEMTKAFDRAMKDINNTIHDIEEQAIDQLVCQDIDLHRITYFPEGLGVDGKRACRIARRFEMVGDKYFVTFNLTWCPPFEHLNANGKISVDTNPSTGVTLIDSVEK